MSYGSAALGSASLSGATASQGALYYRTEALAIGIHRRSLEYLGDADFFQVETRMENEPQQQQRIVRIYSHNDPHETPQLQNTVGGDAFYTQSIIGAARFVVVDLELIGEFPFASIGITITGSEYFQ